MTELQRNFRRVFDEVSHERVPYILTRDSRPEAAMIPYDEYVRFQQMQEDELRARMARLLAKMERVNAAFSDEEVEADLRAADKELAES